MQVAECAPEAFVELLEEFVAEEAPCKWGVAVDVGEDGAHELADGEGVVVEGDVASEPPAGEQKRGECHLPSRGEPCAGW